MHEPRPSIVPLPELVLAAVGVVLLLPLYTVAMKGDAPDATGLGVMFGGALGLTAIGSTLLRWVSRRFEMSWVRRASFVVPFLAAPYAALAALSLVHSGVSAGINLRALRSRPQETPVVVEEARVAPVAPPPVEVEVVDAGVAAPLLEDAGVAEAAAPTPSAEADAGEAPVEPVGSAAVGYLELHSTFGDPLTSQPPDPSTRLLVRDSASPDAATVAVLTPKGVFLPDGARWCAWEWEIAWNDPGPRCAPTEVAYESRGIEVERTSETGVYEVVLGTAPRGSVLRGWLRTADPYHSIEQLLSNRLTYLGPRWDRRLYDAVDGAVKVVVPPTSGDEETGFKTIGEPRRVGNRLWFEVELIEGRCGSGEPRTIARGWVPMHDPEGRLWAWFYSRGC